MKKTSDAKRLIIPSLIPIFILLLLSCETKKLPQDEIIATVDGRGISVIEFRVFYELDPNFGLDSSGISALRDELDFFISQIRALKLAVDDSLTRDSVFVMAVQWERRQAMLRELYRKSISSGLEVDEKQLRHRFLQENMSVHVKHLFKKSRKEIIELKKELEKGIPFAELAAKTFKDSILAANGGDLGWTKISELDDRFSQAVLKLKKGQTSGIVQTSFGFHIIHLIDAKKQLILREDEFNRQRFQLEKKIIRENSVKKSKLFIQAFMASKNPQLNPEIFTFLWRELVSVQEREKRKLNRKIIFDQRLVNKCGDNLKGYLDHRLINFSSGGGVTLGEYLDKLNHIPVSHRPWFNSVSQLANQIAVWIRDELLYEQAIREGLEKAKKVVSDVRRFEEEQSYYYYVRDIIEKITPEAGVIQYFSGDRSENPYSPMAKFRTVEEWKWYVAQKQFRKELKQTIPFPVEVNNGILERENRRINWDRRIRVFSIRKPK